MVKASASPRRLRSRAAPPRHWRSDRLDEVGDAVRRRPEGEHTTHREAESEAHWFVNDPAELGLEQIAGI
jgi:hypothetical protein